MIPVWKVRREVDSLREQLKSLPELVVGPLRKRIADRRFPRDLRLSDGAAAASDKIAVYLIYQPRGLAASVVKTCRHLAGRGYAVLLVANTPLAAADRAQLDACVWRYVERRNFGYDFGGYRDGIRLLQHWQVDPAMLIVLNDSIWFPLDPAETMIREMEDSPAAWLGAQRYVDHLGDIEERTGILMSFFFLFKAEVLRSTAFREFWQRYIPTGNKPLTVRRGERRFSRLLFARGIAGAGAYSPIGFLRAIEAEDDDFLRRTLEYAAYTDADLQAERDRLLASPRGDGWRRQVLDHVRRTVDRRNFHSSFCYASIAALGVPFLKRNRGELQVRMRRQYLRAVAAGDLPAPDPDFLKEIAAIDPPG